MQRSTQSWRGEGILDRARRWSTIWAPALAIGAAAGASASADETLFAPSISAAQSYDDNLFLSSDNRQGSWFWRIEPGARVGLRGPQYQLDASYAFDSEIYPAPYERLGDALERQAADAHLHARLDPQVEAHASGAFRTSEDSRDLVFALANGIDLGRRTAWMVDATGGLTGELDRHVELTADYRYLHQEDEGIGSADTHSQDVGLAWHADRHLTLGVGVLARENLLDMGWVNDAVPSLRVGATLSPSWSVKLAAGPRLGSNGYQTMEGSGDVTWSAHPWSVEAGASRSETTLPGVPLPLDTDGAQLKAALTYSRLALWLSPAYYRSTGVDLTADAFQVEAGLDAQIVAWGALFATYRLTWQEAAGDVAGSARDQLFLVGVAVRPADAHARRPL